MKKLFGIVVLVLSLSLQSFAEGSIIKLTCVYDFGKFTPVIGNTLIINKGMVGTETHNITLNTLQKKIISSDHFSEKRDLVTWSENQIIWTGGYEGVVNFSSLDRYTGEYLYVTSYKSSSSDKSKDFVTSLKFVCKKLKKKF